MADQINQPSERTIESMFDDVRALQEQLADTIPEACRGCWESNPPANGPDARDAYIDAVRRRESRGEQIDDVVQSAERECRKAKFATTYSSLGLCVQGLVVDDVVNWGEIDGEPANFVSMKCGLDARVDLDSPAYDALCKLYASLTVRYKETTDTDESREIDLQLRVLEDQFPVEFDSLFQTVSIGKVYFHGLNLLREEPQNTPTE